MPASKAPTPGKTSRSARRMSSGEAETTACARMRLNILAIEPRFPMEVLDAGEVVAPSVEMLVRYGNGVNAVLFHERVFGSLGSVEVKFFFQKSIDCRVQGKGKSRRSADSEPAIHVKAACTFSKEVNFAAA